MQTPTQWLAARTPQPIARDVLEARLEAAVAAASKLPISLELPRHSIDAAASIARAAGWTVHIVTVRSGALDAPDMLYMTHVSHRGD